MDFCDSENRSHLVETEEQLLQTGLSTEFKEDLNMVICNNEDEDEKESMIYDDKPNKQDKGNESFLSEENLDQDDEKVLMEEEEEEEKTSELNIKLGDEEAENKQERHSYASEKSNANNDLWEDIYGRQRDKQGNVISNRYVPPAMRIANTDISIDNEKICRLQKQLKGILNRLAEQNMYTIANQVIGCQHAAFNCGDNIQMN